MPSIKSQEFLEVINKFRIVTHKYGHERAIPPGEFMMLTTINCKMMKNKKNEINLPGIKVSELSEILYASKPAISRMIKNIEEKELVERIIDKKDRRVVYVSITQKGEKILDMVKEEMENDVIQILDHLGEDDTSELIRILNNLIGIMKKNNKSTIS